MSASSVRSKFMEVEKEKKRQRRLMKENVYSAGRVVQSPVQEVAPVVEPDPIVEVLLTNINEVAPVKQNPLKKMFTKKAPAKKASKKKAK